MQEYRLEARYRGTNLPGFGGESSLYRATGVYLAGGAVGALPLGLVVSPAQAPICPFGRQPCGEGVGDPATTFCCPADKPVCCDPNLPFSLRCCPAYQPDCCPQGDGNGMRQPTPPFFCPPGREHCGEITGVGGVRRQACCEPGTKCCNPDTHHCCPDGAINCCRRATDTSGHVDVCCDPHKETCLPLGNCCPNENVCGDVCCDRTTHVCNQPGVCCLPGTECFDRCCPDGTYCAGFNPFSIDLKGVCCPVGSDRCGEACCRRGMEYCADPSRSRCCPMGWDYLLQPCGRKMRGRSLLSMVRSCGLRRGLLQLRAALRSRSLRLAGIRDHDRPEHAQQRCHLRRSGAYSSRARRLVRLSSCRTLTPDGANNRPPSLPRPNPASRRSSDERVDLVVVAAIGECRHLVQVLGEPRRHVRKPFSIIAVCACRRMTLSDCG
jgi:hypothetical protein